MSAVALFAASELGLFNHPETTYHVQMVPPQLTDDPPAYTALTADVAAEAARRAGVDPALVAIIHLSADYLEDVVERRALYVDPDRPLPRHAAILGIVTPRRRPPPPRLTVVP